jgi:hypothetical protein
MDRNRRVSTHHYSLAHCGECGLLFVSDPPLDIAPITPPIIILYRRTLPSLKSIFHLSSLRLIFCGGSFVAEKLLEVGPSIGQFCALAQKQGFAVSAIEMDSVVPTFFPDI